MLTLKSKIDDSVNFIEEDQNTIGKIESRYVRREEDTFIIYLSSQWGCNKSCRFCWLTQQNETNMENLWPRQFISQIKNVMNHYMTQPKAKKVHVNFMSRGEPLSNHFLETQFFQEMEDYIHTFDSELEVVFKISTIMPWDEDLNYNIKKNNVEIYYSLYSVNEQFRKKWLPKAMDPYRALLTLKDWKIRRNGRIKIHYALIKGENDSWRDATDVVDMLKSLKFNSLEFNIVRFNPFDDKYVESDQIILYTNVLKDNGHSVQIVPRVGYDVYASCGMFMGK